MDLAPRLPAGSCVFSVGMWLTRMLSGSQAVVARASRPCVGCTIRMGATPVPLGCLSRGHYWLVLDVPEIFDGLSHDLEFIKAGRFDQIAIGTQLISALNILRHRGGAEHKHNAGIEFRPLAQPFQNLQAHHPRQLQIHQYQVRKRILTAVREFSSAAQIIRRFATVCGHADGAVHPGLFQGHRHDDDIILVVIDEQNCPVHERFLFRSSSQNLLPWPGSDSKSTFPPMRSTALRTMVSPMPVPSYSSVG